MIATTQEAAGREWAYRLRRLASDLDARGEAARSRELARLAAQTEREVAALHAQHLGAERADVDAEGWCGHWHRTFAAAFACVGLIPAGEVHRGDR
jgi:hypothetical protein